MSTTPDSPAIAAFAVRKEAVHTCAPHFPPERSLLAQVYDGHGGTGAAQECTLRLLGEARSGPEFTYAAPGGPLSCIVSLSLTTPLKPLPDRAQIESQLERLGESAIGDGFTSTPQNPFPQEV